MLLKKIDIVAVTPNPKFLQMSDKQVAVAPPSTSGGATCKFRWRHLQLQVAPPELAPELGGGVICMYDPDRDSLDMDV